MNEPAADHKRTTPSPEDQSKHAAHEAKLAAAAALKAQDAQSIAQLDLTLRMAERVHAVAMRAAEQKRHQADADKLRYQHQLEAAERVVSELRDAQNEANSRVVKHTSEFNALKVKLDQANSALTAATAEADLRSKEVTDAQTAEDTVRGKLNDAELAHQKFETDKADADVTLANAKSDYATKVAAVKKAAADRDMSSFGA